MGCCKTPNSSHHGTHLRLRRECNHCNPWSLDTSFRCFFLVLESQCCSPPNRTFIRCKSLTNGSFSPANAPPARDREMISTGSNQTAPLGTNDDLVARSLAAQIQALMGNMRTPGQQMENQQTSVALSDVLSPVSLAPLFEPSNSSVLASLQDFLPPDLPADPSLTPEDTLRRVIQSAPFQSSVRQLDRAFATGLLGQLMPGLGLPVDAGLSVEAFLKAIHDKAKREHGEQAE